MIKLDLTSEVDRAHALKFDVDVLVNNAGVMQAGSMADIPMWAVREVFETNVFGALELTQGFLRTMVPRGSGKVVWVSSMVGLIVVPWLGAYCASKHAIEAIAATMKAELEGTGVKVATINPGAFRTGFNDTGVETQAQWYDPDTAVLGQPQLQEALDAQFDPAEMIADMVEVITGDDHLYRTVKPPGGRRPHPPGPGRGLGGAGLTLSEPIALIDATRRKVLPIHPGGTVHPCIRWTLAGLPSKGEARATSYPPARARRRWPPPRRGCGRAAGSGGICRRVQQHRVGVDLPDLDPPVAHAVVHAAVLDAGQLEDRHHLVAVRVCGLNSRSRSTKTASGMPGAFTIHSVSCGRAWAMTWPSMRSAPCLA